MAKFINNFQALLDVLPFDQISHIAKVEIQSSVKLPFVGGLVGASFPSPADDFMEAKIDLNNYLIDNPDSTFLVRVQGQSMIRAGIFPNDVLLVDKSKVPKSGEVIIGVLNGEFTLKRFVKEDGQIKLVPANPKYPILTLKEEDEFSIWGVVTQVLHNPNKSEMDLD
jgi:DNA polymerase V